MVSHAAAGQWHGAAHVPVHITQGNIKEFGCPGARDGTLGERPQAQAFKTSGPFVGEDGTFKALRKRQPAPDRDRDRGQDRLRTRHRHRMRIFGDNLLKSL